MKTNLKFLALFLSSALVLTSCSNDDAPVNEEEVITTVIVTLTGGGETITLTSRDLDGDGPNAPEVTVSGDLIAQTTYIGSTRFLNELEDPAEEITEEVEEESDEHQVFYQLLSSLGTVTYTDTDVNGKPIGLTFTLTTGSTAATGNLIVTLRHKLNKNATSVAAGDITNAGGSTDALVTFPIQVVTN
jgi:hypothetical protein